MKHILITLMLIGIGLPLSAQKDLRVSEVFEGKVVHEKGMRKSLVKGESLNAYKLKVLYTTKFTTDSLHRNKVEALFTEDMKGRPFGDKDNLELEYRDGHLYYAVVQIADTGKGLHRYICYQCRKSTKGYSITLVYMEGKATLADLKKTFKKK